MQQPGRSVQERIRRAALAESNASYQVALKRTLLQKAIGTSAVRATQLLETQKLYKRNIISTAGITCSCLLTGGLLMAWRKPRAAFAAAASGSVLPFAVHLHAFFGALQAKPDLVVPPIYPAVQNLLKQSVDWRPVVVPEKDWRVTFEYLAYRVVHQQRSEGRNRQLSMLTDGLPAPFVKYHLEQVAKQLTPAHQDMLLKTMEKEGTSSQEAIAMATRLLHIEKRASFKEHFDAMDDLFPIMFPMST